MTILYDGTKKKDPPGMSAQYMNDQNQCMKYFEKWSEPEQVHFVEQLLARMCHYQHGHINAYLKPMLQRDFISLLPSKMLIFYLFFLFYIYVKYSPNVFFNFLQKKVWITLLKEFYLIWTAIR